jgi:cellulose biosynthesis protein BcsQ
VHVKLRNYVQQLANYCRSQNKELVVFIDTNPALSIYTQIALVAATDLIIPVNADSFSMQVTPVTMAWQMP